MSSQNKYYIFTLKITLEIMESWNMCKLKKVSNDWSCSPEEQQSAHFCQTDQSPQIYHVVCLMHDGTDWKQIKFLYMS